MEIVLLRVHDSVAVFAAPCPSLKKEISGGKSFFLIYSLISKELVTSMWLMIFVSSSSLP